MKDPSHIAILGTGLIGGSLGLVLKRRRPQLRVVGYDRPEVLEAALHRGAIDAGAPTPAEAVAAAEVVFLCTPLGPLLQLMNAIAPHLPAGTVVTDVGSVKGPVLAQAREVLPPTARFLGGHPMAGAAAGGIAHADPLLFENATYVLCPPEGTLEAADDPVVRLVEATGAHVLVLDAERHDRIAAAVSHLPQLLAVMLMNQAADAHEHDDAFLRLAAGGFRDMTRIASSPFPLWRDILVANEGAVLDALSRFADRLQRLRGLLAAQNVGALSADFERSKRMRETIPRDSKGFLHPLADVYVYVEDRPGVLLGITQVLYDAGLNIKDIELLKIREGMGGAFRLSFATRADARAAVATLDGEGHRAYQA